MTYNGRLEGRAALALAELRRRALIEAAEPGHFERKRRRFFVDREKLGRVEPAAGAKAHRAAFAAAGMRSPTDLAVLPGESAGLCAWREGARLGRVERKQPELVGRAAARRGAARPQHRPSGDPQRPIVQRRQSVHERRAEARSNRLSG